MTPTKDPPRPTQGLIGARLKHARALRGWTQSQFGYHAGIGQSEVAMYENGDRQPTAPILAALCRALHCSADYLLNLSEEVTVRK